MVFFERHSYFWLKLIKRNIKVFKIGFNKRENAVFHIPMNGKRYKERLFKGNITFRPCPLHCIHIMFNVFHSSSKPSQTRNRFLYGSTWEFQTSLIISKVYPHQRFLAGRSDVCIHNTTLCVIQSAPLPLPSCTHVSNFISSSLACKWFMRGIFWRKHSHLTLLSLETPSVFTTCLGFPWIGSEASSFPHSWIPKQFCTPPLHR